MRKVALLFLVALVCALSLGSCREQGSRFPVDTEALSEKISDKLREIPASDSLGNTIVIKLDAEAHDDFSGIGDSEVLIAIVGIIFVFGAPVVIVIGVVYVICRFSYRRQRDRNSVITMALQQGVELPKEFYLNAAGKKRSELCSSLTWIAWGVGFLIVALSCGSRGIGIGIASIPILIGGARLIAWRVERRRQSNVQDDSAEQCPEK